MNAELITSTLNELLAHFAFKVDGIAVKAEGDIVRVDIASPEASRMIGWHGETLNAIQNILKSILRTKQKLEKAPFIVLDVDGYRAIQEDKVRKIAEQKAEFVRKTGNRIALSPMSPYFRRIVHTHVSTTPSMSDLTTESIGEGEYRQVVMRLKEEKNKEAASEELTPVMSEDDGLGNLDI